MLEYHMLECLSGCIVAVTLGKSYILHFGDMFYTKPLFSENAVIWVYDGWFIFILEEAWVQFKTSPKNHTVLDVYRHWWNFSRPISLINTDSYT